MMTKVSKWIEAFEERELWEEMVKIYGEDKEVIEDRVFAYLKTLKLYLKVFGDEEVVISRAPGRVNVMGRHVDYMGGYVNPVATRYEIITVIGVRSDDCVVMYNVNPRYKPRRFKISENLPQRKIKSLEEWDKWTVEVYNERVSRGQTYGWDDYVKGLLIYLQDYYRNENGRLIKRIPGLNLVVNGNIPPKRGMSSSSALVVSVAMALKYLIEIDMPLPEFIDRIGYSEWYRLTRGGSADHAAIILSKRGYVSHLSCLPTKVEEVEYAPLPKGYKVVIVDSGFERPHTEEAINYLRVTAAEYRLAVLLVKTLYPQYRNKLKLLRDINIENLGVELDKIYEILKSLPERTTRKELRNVIAEEYQEELETIFANHREPREGYKIRQRALYGLAETERAKVFPKFLREGDIIKVFKLIRTSHDGDRVAKFDEWGNRVKWDPSRFSSDDNLDRNIRILCDPKSSKKQREMVQLYWQPGGYERSIEPIDYMCDVIQYRLGSFAAAQLMGAGLGGNVLVLIREDKVNELQEVLLETYYQKYDVKPKLEVIESGEGASLIRLP